MGVRIDHGVEVETTGEHVNRAADSGCVFGLVRVLVLCLLGYAFLKVLPVCIRRAIPQGWC